MNPSFGTGSTLLGGTSPIDQSLQQRGLSPALLTQLSPAGATYNPNDNIPAYPPMPDKSPMSMLPQQPTGQPQQPQQQSQQPQQAQPQQPPMLPRATESNIILKALINRLQHHTKQEEMGL